MKEQEMSFLDHLEELRWHIIRGLAAVVAVAIWAFVRKDLIFDQIILGPSRPDFISYRALCAAGRRAGAEGLCIDKVGFVLQNRTMTGQFTTHITISLLAGVIIAFPYLFWEVWRFIRPGLNDTERKMSRGAVWFVTFLFLSGIAFGYYILAPLTINFLSSYQISEQIDNFIDLSSYISTLTMMVLACGIMFQLPAVVLVASRAGIVTAAMMRSFRKQAFVVILIISAILTPSPDVFSQLILAIPLYGLYEFSILLAKAPRKAAEVFEEAIA
jgi:sec-independent protein translocase protein TatC